MNCIVRNCVFASALWRARGVAITSKCLALIALLIPIHSFRNLSIVCVCLCARQPLCGFAMRMLSHWHWLRVRIDCAVDGRSVLGKRRLPGQSCVLAKLQIMRHPLHFCCAWHIEQAYFSYDHSRSTQNGGDWSALTDKRNPTSRHVMRML